MLTTFHAIAGVSLVLATVSTTYKSKKGSTIIIEISNVTFLEFIKIRRVHIAY